MPGVDTALLGFPNHKLTLNSSFDVVGGLSIGPSVVWLGQRYGYVSVDEDGWSVLDTFEPALLLNVAVRYENLGLPGLSAGASVHDILDQNPPFIQPYDGWHAPLPGLSREIVGRIAYEF